MKRLFKFMSQKWVISIIGLIALLFVVWFGGPYLGIGKSQPLAEPFNRLLAILIIIFIWGFNNLRHRVKASQANESMIDNLAAAPESEPEIPVDASAEEVATLQQRFEEATKHLKQTSLRDRIFGKQYLYDLPWYIIIGPPGCGKTTLLENSGLEFPLARYQQDKKISGVGGTRNCDWWFTDDAVLLDTAGRYTTQDSDQNTDSGAWLGFLKLLRKHRPRRPLNGVIVALGAEELLTKSDQARELHAQTIRTRLQELYAELGTDLPVYFLVTKMDLIAGFNEFFDDLGQSERAQVWGMTFALDDKKGPQEKTALFANEFDALLTQLNERELWRLYQERDVNRRSLIHGFPQQIAGLKPILETFIQKTFGPNRFERAPKLRGIYLTSGTQQGSPIDRVMSNLAGSFGLNLQSLPAYQGRPRSYFINRLFKDVLFQESELAGANVRYERQRMWLQRGAFSVAIVLAIGIIVAWSTSFTRNQLWVNKLDNRIEQYQQVNASLPAEPNLDEMLKQLDNAKEISLVYQAGDKAPWLMGMGLYQGHKLDDAADQAYLRILQNTLLPDIKSRLESDMLKGRDDAETQRRLLSLYMMLAEPSALDTNTFRPWVSANWADNLGGQNAIHDRMLSHLDALLQTEFKPQSLDARLISKTQQVVCDIPLTRQIYSRLRQMAEAKTKTFNLKRLSTAVTKNIISKPNKQNSVAGFYTFDGYHDIVEEQGLSTANLTIEENLRVCQDKQEALQLADPEQLMRQVKLQYFDDYIAQWDAFLASLTLANINNLNTTVDMLAALSGRESPIEQLVNAISEQTILERAKIKNVLEHFDLTKELSKPSNPVEKRFSPIHLLLREQDDKPSGVEEIRLKLQDLYGYSAEIAEASDKNEAAFEAAKVRMSQKQKDAIRDLRSTARSLPTPIAGIVESAATQSWGTILGSARAHINTVWRSTVLREYRSRIENRYPIFLKGRQDTSLADFGQFFGESGTVDKFISNYLASFIDTRRWRLRMIDGRSIGISSSALKQIRRATQIREMFFQDGGRQATLSFKLKPISLDANVKRFTLDLNGKLLTYQHGPARTTNIEWPGSVENNQVRVIFDRLGSSSFSIIKEGPWAWFQLLDDSDVFRQNDNQVDIAFSTAGLTATYQLDASSTTNPFSTGEHTKFRCPERL